MEVAAMGSLSIPIPGYFVKNTLNPWLVAACVKFFFYDASVLEVVGPDAESFLQGQFSNDVSKLASGQLVYGLWLSLKGKILADSFILRRSEGSFLVVCYQEKGAEIRKWLDGRLFMDEVEIGEPRAVRATSVWDANQLGGLIGDQIPAIGEFSESESVLTFWGRRDSVDVLEILDLEDSESIFESLSNEGSEIDKTELTVRALESRTYSVGDDIREDLPQEVGLDEIGVSYSKGCYVGQEVMARLKAMGRARQGLRTLSLSDSPKGDGPWKLLDTSDRRVGELRRLAVSSSGVLGSALLRLEAGIGPFHVPGQKATARVLDHES